MRVAFGLAAVLLVGCATTSPRFDQELATTFAQDDMHKLETPELELYYPANYGEEAKRVAARAAECIRLLRAHDVDTRARDRVLLFLSSANYNNAYVGGLSGGEPLLSVNPLSVTSEIFHFYGLGGGNAEDVACHEMFHVVHYEQTHGFWNVVNTVLGPVLPPQAFLERWFTEGTAQYYEARLLRRVGRPMSPFYRGSFDSFVAMRGGKVEPGDLQIGQRELNPHSGAYLTGLHFIEWLAEKYGEEKLWQVMDLQARSVLSPFGYTLRFKSVYGLSVGALIEEWEKELTAKLEVRQRPPTEKVLLEDVGQLARVATHPPTGTIAVVSSGNEQVPFLRILNADGTLRAEKRLAKLGTDRDFVFVGPGSMSGLSFTLDGHWLYLLNDDLIDRGDTRAQIWKIDAQTAEIVKVYQDVGRGMAGSVSADGRTYTFADFSPGKTSIIERDLEAGTNAVVAEFAPGVSVGAPAWNRSHTLLAYSQLDANGWNLMVREADGTTRNLTFDGAFNYGARWADDDQLVFMRTAGKYLQAHRINARNVPVRCERLTDAPYGVLDPSPTENGVIFAARDGVHWSIDSAPSSDAVTVTLIEPQPDRPEPSTPSWHATPPLQVTSDQPYSSLDHLFVPQLRVPTAGLGYSETTGFSGYVGLSVMGRDRLSRHTWAINGTLGIPNVAQNSLQLGYRNAALAPWSIIAAASRYATTVDAYWTGLLAASRTIFTVPLSFGVQTEVWQQFGAPTEKFIGAYASLSYSAGDGTQYAGAQRTFSFSLDLAGYPRAFGSDRDMLDVRGSVAVAIPLPFSKRHSFLMSAVGRTLPGAPTGALAVGGISSANTLWQYGSRDAFPSGPGIFLPGTLVEGARGFDDFVMRANHAAIFNARYRYSFIVDRGTASVLWVLPSFFLRQIDVEAFGTGVVTDQQVGRAVGAAVSIRSSLGGFIPVSLSYQFAWRFDFGLPPLHVVAVSFD